MSRRKLLKTSRALTEFLYEFLCASINLETRRCDIYTKKKDWSLQQFR